MDLNGTIESLTKAYDGFSEKIKAKMTKEQLAEHQATFNKLDDAIRNFDKVDPAKLFNDILNAQKP